MSTIVVTGTGTGIGKTIVTAAVAAAAHANGQSVAVVKPVQTGVDSSESGDIDVVRRLSGVADVHEFARYPDPLAPATAARRAGVPVIPVETQAQMVGALRDRDLVLVEGAGGLLVRLDEQDHTIADLAAAIDADVLVVATAGLGTLNMTALTCDRIRASGLNCLGVVIGAWPTTPDLAAWCNLDDLPTYAAAPLLGSLPDRAEQLGTAEFLSMARSCLAHPLGGHWAPPGRPPESRSLD
jgi:dethiobiotin synthetase